MPILRAQIYHRHQVRNALTAQEIVFLLGRSHCPLCLLFIQATHVKITNSDRTLGLYIMSEKQLNIRTTTHKRGKTIAVPKRCRLDGVHLCSSTAYTLPTDAAEGCTGRKYFVATWTMLHVRVLLLSRSMRYAHNTLFALYISKNSYLVKMIIA